MRAKRGCQRPHTASISNRLLRVATSNIAAVSLALSPSGFSHRTCLPASSDFVTHSICWLFDKLMYTASTRSSANNSSYDAWTFCGSRVADRCSSRLATAYKSAPRDACTAGARPRLATKPAPRKPQFTVTCYDRRSTGVTGMAFCTADCSAACIIATTLRDCNAFTSIAVPLLMNSTIER